MILVARHSLIDSKVIIRAIRFVLVCERFHHPHLTADKLLEAEEFFSIFRNFVPESFTRCERARTSAKFSSKNCSTYIRQKTKSWNSSLIL
jgi:hypothetical protein